MFDKAAILANNKLTAVAAKVMVLKKDGREWKGCCPFHKESTPSFTIYHDRKSGEEKFKCFGCTENGNVIDFVMAWNRVGFSQACKMLGGAELELKGEAKTKHEVEAEVNPYEGYSAVVPVPADVAPLGLDTWTPEVFNPKRDDEKTFGKTKFKPRLVHPYRDEAGQLVGYVIRHMVNPKDKADAPYKITPSLMYARRLKDGVEGWCLMRPTDVGQLNFLYGLDRLTSKPEAAVLIVEGEKAADAGHQLLKNWVTMTWLGGTNGVGKARWNVEGLKGRRVVFMPDNDEPGLRILHEVCKAILSAGAASVEVVMPDMSLEEGWDIADAVAAGWNARRFAEYAKARMVKYTPDLVVPEWTQKEPVPASEKTAEKVELQTGPMAPENESTDTPPVDAYNDMPPDDDRPVPMTSVAGPKFPFNILGYNRGVYYYMPKHTQQIIELTSSQHTKLRLLDLADIEWWERNFSFSGKGEKIYAYAANNLMQEAAKRGIFDKGRSIRGRGAWNDSGRRVIHAGDAVFVDGKQFEPADVPSKFVYEKGESVGIDPTNAATNAEAHALLEICEMVTWEHKISAALLCGFCVVAPVSGLLPWRSHIWLTGDTHSGKSTILKDIVERVCGKMTLHVQGGATEPSLRQMLRQDAMAVIYDEAEPDEDSFTDTMKGVLTLARVSAGGGEITKGGQDGVAVIYPVRSSFCFSSINPSLSKAADKSRVSKLTVKRNTSEDAKEHFNDFMGRINSTFTPKYAERMLGRTMRNMDALLHNIEVFTDACHAYFGNRRIGQTLSPLIAGFYLCHSRGKVTYDEAMKLIDKHEWNRYAAGAEQQDHMKMMTHLMMYKVKTELPNSSPTLTIGELVEACLSPGTDASYCAEAKELRRHGIVIQKADVPGKFDMLVICTAGDNPPIKRIMYRTPWRSSWSDKLQQFENATEVKNTMYFAPGMRGRGVAVPLYHILPEK